jgi:ribose-phosphate pyrophosphokinase
MKTQELHLYLQAEENTDIKYKSFNFAAGERQFQLLAGYKGYEKVDIYFKYMGDSSLFELMMAVNALKNNDVKNIELYIPYFPGARQDRICNEGEAFTLKMYAKLINDMDFEKVHIFDPHSEVTPALINNVVVHKNWNFVKFVCERIQSSKVETGAGIFSFPDYTNMVLVSPDAGAEKKVFDLTKYLDGIPVVRAGKIRDVKNGKILETVVYSDDLTDKIAIIVDDVASYGGTFKALAKKLKEKNAAKVYLVVSHFEGVANLRELKESGIDGVYTTNSFALIDSNDYNKDGFVKILDIWNVM